MTVDTRSLLIDDLVQRSNRIPQLEADLRDARADAARRLEDTTADRIVAGVLAGLAGQRVESYLMAHRVVLRSTYQRGSRVVGAAGETLCATHTAGAADAIINLLAMAGVKADRG